METGVRTETGTHERTESHPDLTCTTGAILWDPQRLILEGQSVVVAQEGQSVVVAQRQVSAGKQLIIC